MATTFTSSKQDSSSSSTSSSSSSSSLNHSTTSTNHAKPKHYLASSSQQQQQQRQSSTNFCLCCKFIPQAFNPNKCQQCFNMKELHSAEALAEYTKVSSSIYFCSFSSSSYKTTQFPVKIKKIEKILAFHSFKKRNYRS